jgi:hypothetical protein
MIEMRIIDNGLGCRPDFQYRYHQLEYDWYEGRVNPPFRGENWSEWKTAEWVKAEEIENA